LRSHEVVVLSSVTTTVKVAYIRLCHSRMFLVRTYPRDSETRGSYDFRTVRISARVSISK